jgi:FAD-dependent urate hydroxylase
VKRQKQAAIIGAGIGGLAAGIALQRIGWNVQLYERADRLSPLNHSFALLPTVVLALRKLQIDDVVMKHGKKIREVVFRKRTGQMLSRFDFTPIEEETGIPALSITRSRLQEVLADKCGPGRVSFGKTLTGYEQKNESVVLTFADKEVVEYDLLVGADGIDSRVRNILLDDGRPRYSGCNCWVGLSEPAFGLLPEQLTVETWGRGARFAALHSSDQLLYWYFALNEQTPTIRAERGDKSEVLRYLRGWHQPIADIVASTPEEMITKIGIYDRKPARNWSFGHVTLLGDAAHPIAPNVGSGAGSSIEDAVALASSLESVGSIWAALKTYQGTRMPRARIAVQRADRFASVGHSENSLAIWLRDKLMRGVSEEQSKKILRRYVDIP